MLATDADSSLEAGSSGVLAARGEFHTEPGASKRGSAMSAQDFDEVVAADARSPVAGAVGALARGAIEWCAGRARWTRPWTRWLRLR